MRGRARSGLSRGQRVAKRALDLAIGIPALLVSAIPILLGWLMARLDTGDSGFFTQVRVGQNGRHFRIVKLRTMRAVPGVETTVTRDGDPRITRIGRFLRKTKIDELPQLWNVVIGDMSLVGPRPDVPGFADQLTGEDRIILNVKPGITGPATLQYRREEELLRGQPDPERFNREVVFPAKVRINREYVENYSLRKDLVYLKATLLSWMS